MIIRWKATIHLSIKINKRETAEANPIWSYYTKKEPEEKTDIIGQRRNKRHKRVNVAHLYEQSHQ